MVKEIKYRLFGLESIIHRLHHNLGLMKYTSYALHKEPFNLFNNLGLYWIWGLTIGDQIIDFYKVIAKDEKFSFAKIINISRDLKCGINYELVEKKIKGLKDEYDKDDFETVRSKYLAHQDLRVPEIKTDLLTISSLTENIIKLFNTFSKEFKGKRSNFSNDVVNSFKEIFDIINEYEKVKAFLMVAQIKGQDTVKISRLAKSIKKK
jgi:hypothetical protein